MLELHFLFLQIIHSAYEIQFYVMNKRDTDSVSTAAPKILIHPPLSKPEDSLVSLDIAQAASKPVSFFIRYDNTSQFPEELDISEDTLQQALKDGTTYQVVTVAITATADVSDTLTAHGV